MPVFVVLAVGVAVAAIGAVVVAALQLLRASRGLRAGMDTALQRLQPLTDELNDETAVTAVELEALQDDVDGLVAERRGRRRPAPLRRN